MSVSRPKVDPNWPERVIEKGREKLSETETTETEAPEPEEPEEETNGEEEESGEE